MNTCVVIPTFNEAESIASIIKKIKELDLEVVVVDDGSQDDTVKIAKSYGAIVIRNASNIGKGGSLRKGFEYALKNNFEAIVTMDGDGQHLPEDILNFIRRAKESDAAIFVGNRMSNPINMPLSRKLTNLVMSAFISFLVKQRIADTQCGFRLIKRELLEKLKLTTQHYETESEILIKAVKLGYYVESVGISCIYRNKRSRIKPLTDTFRFIWLLMRLYIKH